MNKTTYVLRHRITKKRLPIPDVFNSMTEGNYFALIHDLQAECVPITADLFGMMSIDAPLHGPHGFSGDVP